MAGGRGALPCRGNRDDYGVQMRNLSALLLSATAVAAAGLLTACGGSASGTTTSAASPALAAPSATAAATSAPSDAASAPAAATSPTASPSVSLATLTVDGVTVSGTIDEKPVITVTPGQPAPASLVAQDVVTGTGKAITATGTGTFNYTGVLFSDGTTFDSSWDRGQPITFPLNRVIPGWQQGLTGMQEGGRRLLIIPPSLAYGSQALPGIPPNSTLVFVVDLEKVN